MLLIRVTPLKIPLQVNTHSNLTLGKLHQKEMAVMLCYDVMWRFHRACRDFFRTFLPVFIVLFENGL